LKGVSNEANTDTSVQQPVHELDDSRTSDVILAYNEQQSVLVKLEPQQLAMDISGAAIAGIC
jgi:hypothetical protein